MSLPPAVAQTLAEFGVSPQARVAISDLFLSLGPAVVEVVAEICQERGIAPGELSPEDLEEVRPRIGERFLQRHHGQWLAGRPVPGFWRDRRLDGGSTGLATPLGELEGATTSLAERVARTVRRATGPHQPRPRGLLLLSRNSHFGNRPEVFSVDLVPAAIDEAVNLNWASGRQHTLPGSIGETSGSLSGAQAVALIWEIQPNAYRPVGERNRMASQAWRRHRNWHLATLAAAVSWLRDNRFRVFVLRGAALRATHEVNPLEPVTEAVTALHDRTVASVTRALDLRAREPGEEPPVADALRRLANVGLGREMERTGLPALLLELVSADSGREPGEVVFPAPDR